MRHFAASLWIKAGASQYLVMEAGGWASLEMVVRTYGHLWASDIPEQGRRVDEVDWDELDRRDRKHVLVRVLATPRSPR